MKRIGIPEIARLANVTIGTVDRALHGRKGISEGTRKRILEIARNVGYRPNPAARALSVGRERLCIGVCIPQEIRYYFDQIRLGISAEARRAELFAVELIWRQPAHLGAAEIENVMELVDCKPKALILTPGDPDALGPVIDEAERKNVRVICVDTDAPSTRRSTAVCVDGEVSGKLAAELLGGLVPPGSPVAVVTGMLTTEDHRRKTQAFLDAWPRFCDGGVVAELIEAHENEEEGFQKCFALLNQRELAGVYVNTVNCLPVCRAIGALGQSGRVKLVTSDLFREMGPYFEKGTISASIYARPYVQGEIAMRVALDHLVHGAPIPAPHYLAPQVVMRSTFHLYREMREPPVRRDPSVGVYSAV
jgi:LacI family transcriptional regulator